MTLLTQDVAKAMDLPVPETLEEAVRQRDAWINTAAYHHRNEEYYRGLVQKVGEILGSEAFTADDGVVHDSVLCAKVPKLVQERLG